LNNSVKYIVDNLPGKPGVYQFFNIKGDVIYVGKAKDLKKRVSSYFNRNNYDSAKLRVLVSKIEEIKHIEVETESDALLLENNLIKKLKPKYNVLLKDDKTYPWICIKHEDFPRVFTTRRIINDGSQYFGPYTSGTLLKTILELIRNLYPIRTCNLTLSENNIKSKKFKPCLEFQIGNCLAPCIANQSITNYNDNIKSISEILKGNLHSVKKLLIKTMDDYSKSYKFEEAHRIKLRIESLERFQAKSTIVNPTLKNIDVFSLVKCDGNAYVNFLKINNGLVIQSHNIEIKINLDETESDLLLFAITEIRLRLGSKTKDIIVPFRLEYAIPDCKFIVPSRGDKLKLLELSMRNANAFAMEKQRSIEKQDPQIRVNRILTSIQNDFKTNELPRHIECFDNSNLQGTNPVSACVVFKNGVPSKKDYRIFNIKSVEGPDDYASMREVLERRYKRIIDNNEPLPQLIVIDGGKGQLSASFNILKGLGIHEKVQVVGIAKRLEEIYFPNDPIPIYLDKNSESLKVIQFARNEAHRFGIKNHRNKRSKEFLTSELESIVGVGEQTIQLLFSKFKSINIIMTASIIELEPVIGKRKAEIVYNYFKNK
jgi:excinuclease ABC subunit C